VTSLFVILLQSGKLQLANYYIAPNILAALTALINFDALTAQLEALKALECINLKLFQLLT